MRVKVRKGVMRVMSLCAGSSALCGDKDVRDRIATGSLTVYYRGCGTSAHSPVPFSHPIVHPMMRRVVSLSSPFYAGMWAYKGYTRGVAHPISGLYSRIRLLFPRRKVGRPERYFPVLRNIPWLIGVEHCYSPFVQESPGP